MELKSIFKMTKTDRYTQDGRDELAKLQETEDVKYKTGDISQKTGLQKQPDGSWAPPKKGGAGAGNEYYKNDVRTEAGEKKILSETKTEVLQSKIKDLEETKKKNGGKLGVYGEKSLQLAKEELAKRSKPKAKFDEYGLPDNETISMKDDFLKKEKVADPSKLSNAEFNALAKKLDSELGIGNMERAQELLITPREEKSTGTGAPEGKWQNSDALDFVHKLPPLNEAKTEQLFKAQDKLDEEWIAKKGNVDKERFEQAKALIKGELNKRGTTGKDYWTWKKTASDSAPRILTGDTKIRIKK